MYLEITNDIHLGLKFGRCNAENRKKNRNPKAKILLPRKKYQRKPVSILIMRR